MHVTAQRRETYVVSGADSDFTEGQPGTSEQDQRGPEIVVRGRRVEVTEGLRRHVEGKLARLERLDHKLFRLDVEISEEKNPRLSASCDRVEITCYSRGPVVRAEASAPDIHAALDLALGKLEERLRRAAERRHSRGSRVAQAQAVESRIGVSTTPLNGSADGALAGLGDEDGPFVVREKDHAAVPMTLDDALSNMELVGHDFFLFEDVETGCASVVYRRRGYHYGVLRLRVAGMEPAGRG